MGILVRLLGWLLVVTAVLAASADAVMALGTGSYSGIATRDVWTLISGKVPAFADLADGHGVSGFRYVVAALLEWPAWTVIGPLGWGLVLLGRAHARRQRHHHGGGFT
ncbi:MAG: hypothetical protein ABT940_01625 [Alphaproteobacteria bacterium]